MVLEGHPHENERRRNHPGGARGGLEGAERSGSLEAVHPGLRDRSPRRSDTEIEARVIVKVGPVKAGFTGVVNLSDLNPPASYRISGEGKGGLAGFATGGADVRLEDTDGGTKLSYDVDAQVGGKLAMLGSRLIDFDGALDGDPVLREIRQRRRRRAG